MSQTLPSKTELREPAWALQRVFVSGLGLVSAGGRNAEENWESLRAGGFEPRPLPSPLDVVLPGVSCLPIPEIPDANFPLRKAAARFLSQSGRHLVVAVAEALAQSGLKGLDLGDLGISIGASNGDRRDELEPFLGPETGSARERFEFVNARLRRGATRALKAQPGLIGGNLAIWCGAQGPVSTFIDTALAGGIAIGEATRSVAMEECPGMIAGGTFDLDDPWVHLWRRENRAGELHAPLLASTAACVVLEAGEELRRRGGRALAEVLAYRPAQPGRASTRALEIPEDLELVAVITNVPEGGASWSEEFPGAGRAPVIFSTEQMGDSLGATPAVHVSLAAHLIGVAGAAAPGGRRRCVLAFDVDERGASTAFLLAEVRDENFRTQPGGQR